MATSASQIGSLNPRQPGSHVCSPALPSVVTETQQSTQSLLFHRPPSRLFLPPIYPGSRPPPFDAGISRHHWQFPCQNLYKHAEYELPARTDYGIFDGLEISRNSEGSPGSPSGSYFTRSRGGTAFYPICKREESDLFIPLSSHSRALPGILGQPSTCLSEEQLRFSTLQSYHMLSEAITEAPIALSSGSSSSFIARSTNSVTGNFTNLSVLDTSADTSDFSQYVTSSVPEDGTAPEFGASRGIDGSRENVENGSIGPLRSKKQRITKGRERVRIALAPDQPPTTQGKQRERVYVACQQCRSRKIRCDGAKPMCFNCNQRGTGICEFDPVPKRRGPDRQPGARQRHGKVPSPRRRRRTRSDKEEETPGTPARSPLYLATRPGSDFANVSSNDQNTTWACIPSSPSSASTNGHGRGPDQPVPGSSGSDASQPHDYRTLLTPSFAFNAPQDGYVVNTLKPDDARLLASRIATEPVIQSSSSPFSPETPASVSYSAIMSPFGTQPASSYSNVSSTTGAEAPGVGLDCLPRLDTPTSPVSIGLTDFASRDLNVVQPVAIDQEPMVQAAYTSFGILATQRQVNDYSTIPDADTSHSRRDSLGSVTSDSYNPYQWAVYQGQGQYTYGACISPSEDEENVVPYELTIVQTPSLDFVRKTWWDSLLDSYCAEPYCTPAIAIRYELAYGVSVSVPRSALVTGATRQRVAQIIVHDLQTVFRDTIFWFAFFNVPLFFGTFFRARETMQPALVFALLVWSNYLRSSTVDLGAEGMRRTLWLKEKAQAALDASVNASWIDPGLAQAAWLLSLFELSSHPERSVARLHSALETLDNIIHTLALTFIDAPDPSISVLTDSVASAFRSSAYANGTASHLLPMPLYNRQPIAGLRPKPRYSSQLLQYHSPYRDSANRQLRGMAAHQHQKHAPCICNELSLGKVWSEAKDHVPFWLGAPGWNPKWNDTEVRREECRRLCWNTLHLFAGYTTYRTSVGLQHLDLFLLQPANIYNIFPGENLTDLLPSTTINSKFDTVWSLYARAILLWHACLRIRNVSERERAIFAQSVWLEADAIENTLDGHSCGIERAFLYHGREYLFNARMYVSSEFRRFVPHPSPDMSGAVHRKKAEEWLTHQATLAKRIMHGLQALTGLRGSLLARRPFFCYWFMGHLSRCLQLWYADKSLTVALELAKNFLSPINYLSALWPCEEQRASYASIQTQLENACLEAGLEPPPPIDPSFPLPTNLSYLP
ncbi:hypothetical protein A7U60_g5665 [Sanghuangporus baumii]|uniref:Zn(2)-C6 fungal-type domain-containing protein n=1 Tax=Sanghuangporus baumii TaxID=108892 RepID=A0A9Q5N7Q7_SANBA|nr:hypothetical protein A7U60_g5665 [Sanghuangporus baumii]